MRKHFLIDTSVILDDPENLLQLYSGGENSLYITNVILSELDQKKTERVNVGFFARLFFRGFIGSEAKAIRLKRGKGAQKQDAVYRFDYDTGHTKGPIRLYVIHRENYKPEHHRNDLKILEIAESYNLRLITNDLSFKIIALSRGAATESFYEDTVADYKSLEFFHSPKNSMAASETDWAQYEEVDPDGRPHFFIRVGGHKEPCDFEALLQGPALIVPPHNLEQMFYLSILTHPQNRITVAAGSTGSGKTLMALQAGLMLQEMGEVDGIVYLRNTVEAVGHHERLGFRAGDEDRKLGYFMYPLFSAINLLIEELRKKSIKNAVEYSGEVNSIESKNATKRFIEKHNIEMYDLAHARGITIARKFVIFDESQNASLADIKLLGTRLGKGSRIVFLGDTQQVDSPYLTRDRNGLVAMLKKAHTEDFVAGVQLRSTIRSEISRWFGQNL